MKKIVFLFAFATLSVVLFTNCQKETLQPDAVQTEQNAQSNETVLTGTFTVPEDEASSRNEPEAYQYSLMDFSKNLTSFYYKLKVVSPTGQIVHQSGGWFAINVHKTLSLVPGQTYTYHLTLEPPYQGQTGSITARLRKLSNYSLCMAQSKLIPSVSAQNIPSCE